MITYQVEHNLSSEEFKEVLVKSTLGERRPIDDSERLKTMIKNADLVITARDHNKLIGVSRSVTDFVYCCYLSDLAVDKAYQKLGIGRELIKQTKQKTPKATLILLAAPAAETYYPHIGMKQTEVCFLLKDLNDLR
ncbi:GNAT family N-acetyltransferase [Winogradskyella sp. PC D3.3]